MKQTNFPWTVALLCNVQGHTIPSNVTQGRTANARREVITGIQYHPSSPHPLSTSVSNELADPADLVAKQFSDHRHSEEFNELSLVIDNSDPEHSTLIVHIDGQQPNDLTQGVEVFLRDHDARTERERYSETDIRILATLE